MSTAKVNIGIEAILSGFDKASGGLAKFGLAINGLEKAFRMISAPIGKALDVSSQLLSIYAVQQESIIKLNASLKAQGNYSEEATNGLQDLASELQSVTKFGDETSLEALALTESLSGLNAEGLQKLLPSMQDLATGLKMDIMAVASLTGKTLGSTMNAFTRYGIELDAQGTKQEKLAQLIEQVNMKFKGQARALALTGTGGLEQIKNLIGDIQEQLGSVVDKLLQSGVNDYILAVVQAIQEVVGGFVDGEDSVGDFGEVAINIMRGIVGWASKLEGGFLSLKLVWKTLEIAFISAFGVMSAGMFELFNGILIGIEAVAKASDQLFGTNLSHGITQMRADLNSLGEGYVETLKDAKGEWKDISDEISLANAKAELLMKNIENNYMINKKNREESEVVLDESLGSGGGGNSTDGTEVMDAIDKIKGLELLKEKLGDIDRLGDGFYENTVLSVIPTTDIKDNLYNWVDALTDAQGLMGVMNDKSSSLKDKIASILPLIGTLVGTLLLPGLGTAGGGALGSLLGAGLTMFASGGVINEPTLLSSLNSGKPYGVMAEAGPEKIVPIGGGGGGNITVHVHSPIFGDDDSIKASLNKGFSNIMRENEMMNNGIMNG